MARGWVALALAATVVAGAVVSAGEGAPEKLGTYTPKGFLSDYSHLQPVDGHQKAYRYIKPGVDFSRYRKVMVDRIKVFLKEDAEYKGIDPQELNELVTYFHKAIEKALGKAYPVVNEPGPDVLRLRIAVTDLVPNKPEASVVSLVVPYLWVGEAGAGAAQGEAGSTPFIGEASIEVEAMDSRSAEQLAAYIERHVGKKYNWTNGVDTAVSDYLKAYSTWAYTRQAMDGWAGRIREWMDRVHGVKPDRGAVKRNPAREAGGVLDTDS